MEDYKTLKAGQPVNFEKQPGDKGFHAVNITAVETSTPTSNSHDVDHDEFISVEEPSYNELQARQAPEKTTSSEEKAKAVSA
jgi:CspA family cold shock protein